MPAASPSPADADPLRVAVFTGNYNMLVDGVAVTTNRQVQHLLDQNIPVRVYAPTAKTALPHAGDLISVPSVPLPKTVYRLALGLPQHIREDLKAFRPNLVHLASPDWLGFAAQEWARRRRLPVVSTFHTHFADYAKYYGLKFAEPLAWKLLAWFSRRCQAVYVSAESMAAELRAHGVAANFVHAPFGVDQLHFNPGFRSDAWRAAHGLGSNDIGILFVGRLVWEKGLAEFAEVVNRLTAAGLPVKAVVVGEGPAGDELRKRLPAASYTGRLSGQALGTAYASCDVFLFPSASETFGLVTVEALASGLVCVVADATGSRDIVRADIDGLVCPPYQADGFYAATAKLVTDPAVRATYRAAGLARAVTYRWDVVLAAMVENFKRAAAMRP